MFPCYQIDPIEYVEDICENMQLFPKEDFLTGDQLMFEYNPEVSSSVVVGFLLWKAAFLFLDKGVDETRHAHVKKSGFYTIMKKQLTSFYIRNKPLELCTCLLLWMGAAI